MSDDVGKASLSTSPPPGDNDQQHDGSVDTNQLSTADSLEHTTHENSTTPLHPRTPMDDEQHPPEHDPEPSNAPGTVNNPPTASPATPTPPQFLAPQTPQRLPPPPPDSSYMDMATFAPDDTMNVSAVRAHLQDVESSFMPDLSPVADLPSRLEGDTQLLGPETPLARRPKPASRQPSVGHETQNSVHSTAAVPLPTRTPTTPTPTVPQIVTPDGNPSSTQTPSNTTSSASPTYTKNVPAVPSSSSSPALNPTPTAHAADTSAHSSHLSSTSTSVPTEEDATMNSLSSHSSRRPKYLKSRVASQRSSISSFLTNPEGDELSSELTVNPIDTLEPLNEDQSEDRSKTPQPDHGMAPDFPGSANPGSAQYTESIIRKLKFGDESSSPRKLTEDYSAMSGARPGKSLTLKEQSSTIERLSKENFDLKLKVMFLKDRLDKLSEEGIKQMISENVDLKTSLAVTQRDNKVLRRRVKELEKQLKEEDYQRPDTAKSSGSSNENENVDPQYAQEREEELLYLRERVEEYVVEMERLKLESLNRENEKRKLTDIVRSLSERTGESLGRQEEADVWKDLLEQETARREQVDEDNRRLRDEVFRLKQDLTTGLSAHNNSPVVPMSSGKRSLFHSPSRPSTGLSSEYENSTTSGSATLVDELRRESEQLRHENAELRREVGAQTSMLTSRNREKERLYQEIEDLKMAQRRAGVPPSTIDSILDRSASRAGRRDRSHSRASGATRTTLPTPVEEANREAMENRMAELRDKINELKINNQELTRELNTCMSDFEMAIEAKQQAEQVSVQLQEDLEAATNDLLAIQAERDEVVKDHSDLEAEFEALRKEAQDEINALEAEADQRNQDINRLEVELNDRTENFEALQDEMRKMSDALLRLEDDAETKLRRIHELEGELDAANKELEVLEQKLHESNEKANRLGVQQESSAGEIAFLREEQETDKIRIGDLEAALTNTETNLTSEKERAQELEKRLMTERRQREIVANREKEDVQRFVNELNREATAAQDEVRRLRKTLSSREVEATEWKERLMELENNLREALGDINGTRSSLLKSIANLQRQLENTTRELDSAKALLVEKDRQVKERDSLLESQTMESRRLVELLEKEQHQHRNTKNAFETFQKTHQHVSHTVSTQEARIAELENSRAVDKRKMASLETAFKDQMTERNNLLLALWARLSTLCGTDWAMNNSLINGRALPSLESVSTMLPGFSKNLLHAVKTIEQMLGGFSTRVKSLEKDLWREYQSLENNLEVRTKKLERLEGILRNSVLSSSASSASRGSPLPDAHGSGSSSYRRLEEAYRQLKVENATLRSAADARSRGGATTSDPPAACGSPSPGIPTGPRDKDRNRKIPVPSSSPSSGGGGGGGANGGSSPRSSSSTRDVVRSSRDKSGGGGGSGGLLAPGDHGNERGHSSGSDRPATSSMEHMHLLRLKDLEGKLAMEREARNQDRRVARTRLSELEDDNRSLRGEVAKLKRAMNL